MPPVRILIVSHLFPPSQPVGVLRISKLAKYWSRAGDDVTVLTSDVLVRPAAVDTYPSEAPGVRVVLCPTPTPFRLARSLKDRYQRNRVPLAGSAASGLPQTAREQLASARLLGRLRTQLLLPDSAIAWLPAARRMALALHEEHPFDLVFSSAPPWSNLVTAAMVSRQIARPLVIDFRDPWGDGDILGGVASWSPYERFVHRRLERFACDTAKLIVATTPRIAASLQSRCRPSAPVQVVENGFDTEDVPPEQPKTNVFRIVMTSAFRAGDLFRPFVEALRRCVVARPPGAQQIRFTFAGFSRAQGASGSAISEYFAEAGLSEIFENAGLLSKTEAIGLQRSADLCLFIEPPFKSLPGGMIGTEFYEYLATGKPVLLLDEESSDVWAVGRPAGTVSRCDTQDVDAIEAKLLEMLRYPESVPQWDWIQRFSRANQAARIQALLRSLCASAPLP